MRGLLQPPPAHAQSPVTTERMGDVEQGRALDVPMAFFTFTSEGWLDEKRWGRPNEEQRTPWALAGG